MIVYKVTNKINGKIYIGQTTKTLETRFKEHQVRGNLLFQAIKKHGVENFKIEEIDSACSMDELNALEEYHIHFNNSITPGGYNLRAGGNCSTFSEATKKKMSEAKKGKTPWNKGVRNTEEYRKELQTKRLRKDRGCGKHRTPRSLEHCEKLSKVNALPVTGYNLKTQITIQFNSGAEAAVALGLNKSTINKGIGKNYKTRCGWKFERKEK
jgi:group I intron endonuclease